MIAQMVATSRPTIRPAERGDIDRIVDFMQGFFPTLRDNRAYAVQLYDWKYFDLAGRDTGYPPAFLAEDEAGMLGFMGCMPFTLRYQGQHIPAGWVSDWRIHERARGRGLGRELVRTAREYLPALAAVNGSSEAQRVYLETGFQSWDCSRAWLRVYRPLRYEWARHSGRRKPLAVYRAAQHLLSAQCAVRPSQPPRVQPGSSEYPARGLPLFKQQQTNGPERKDSYLAWLVRCPDATTSFHLLFISNQPCGYVLLRSDYDRRGLRRGRILELFVLPGAEALTSDAYQASLDYMRQAWNVDYTDLVAPAAHADMLPRLGLQPRRVYRLWLNTDAFALRNEDNWWLTLVDKDNAFRGSGINP